MGKKKGGGKKKKGGKSTEAKLPESLAVGDSRRGGTSSFRLLRRFANPAAKPWRVAPAPLPQRRWMRLPHHVVRAVEVDDDATVWAWLASGGEIDAVWDAPDGSVRGYTMLMLAGLCGHERLAEELLQRGACLGLRTSRDISAFALAQVSGRNAIAQMLLRRGADVIDLWPLRRGEYTEQDADRARAFHFVDLRDAMTGSRRGDDEAMLAADAAAPGAGAEAAAAAASVPDAIADAAAAGDEAVAIQRMAEWLDDGGGAVDALWRGTMTVLMLASEIGAEELVQFLLNRGASTSLERGTDGATALSIALTRNHRSIVTRLVNTRGPLPLSGGSGSGSRGRPAKSSGRKKK